MGIRCYTFIINDWILKTNDTLSIVKTGISISELDISHLIKDIVIIIMHFMKYVR